MHHAWLNNCVLRVTTAAHNRGSRPGQNKRLRTLSVGDALLVCKLNRLGRSMWHLVVLLEELFERGINFRALAQSIFAQQWGDGSCKSKTICDLRVIVWFLCEQKIFIRNDYVNHFILPTASLSKEKNTPVFPEWIDFFIQPHFSALRLKNASFLCGISSFHHDVFDERWTQYTCAVSSGWIPWSGACGLMLQQS